MQEQRTTSPAIPPGQCAACCRRSREDLAAFVVRGMMALFQRWTAERAISVPSPRVERVRCRSCARLLCELTAGALRPAGELRVKCRSCNALNVIRGV
jgi:hypothetical protein